MIEHLWPLSVSAFYVGERGLGLRSCEKLLCFPLDESQQGLTLKNRTYYIDSLSIHTSLTKKTLSLTPSQDGWSVTNPSIIRHQDHYWVLFKSSNKFYSDDYQLHIKPANSKYVSDLVLAKLDLDFNVISHQVLGVPDIPTGTSPYTGIEDARPFIYGGEIWINGIVRNFAKSDDKPVCCLAKVTDSGLRNIHLIESPKIPTNTWIPILGKPYNWLYDFNESGNFAFCTLNGGKHTKTTETPTIPIARQFRPGSQIIGFDGGYLTIVKEVSDWDASIINSHRFVWFDQSMALSKISDPFFLESIDKGWNLESVHGVDLNGPNLVVSYSTHDTKSYIAQIPSFQVLSLLKHQIKRE